MYEYRAELVRVVAGDTVDIEVDLGLDITHEIRVRLMGINPPAVNTGAGRWAKTYVESILPTGAQMHCRTVEEKTGTNGRYLADLTIITTSGELSPSTVSATMLAARRAGPYTGEAYESAPVFDSFLD
jgi:endonuclease YncB( thermonuclease family)